NNPSSISKDQYFHYGPNYSPSVLDEQMETIRHQYQRPIFSLRLKPQCGLLGSIKS
ncbi:MAG: hypothetical protein ACI9IJ_002323, partial [Psychromonas sp.]